MMSFQSRPRVPRTRSAQRSESEAVDRPAQTPMRDAPARKRVGSTPGWSSSSLELMEGLEVNEEVPLDQLPAEWADRLRRR